MLTLRVPLANSYNEVTQEFVVTSEKVFRLEHSLASLSKWEAIWEKPFMSTSEKTYEMVMSYVQCMSQDEISKEDVMLLTPGDHDKIAKYIEAPSTATWFGKTKDRPSREVITSELIYYWMISATIPFECENWHLNRLLTLIKICSVKNAPAKKMSRSELAARNRELNKQRRAQLNTNG